MIFKLRKPQKRNHKKEGKTARRWDEKKRKGELYVR
jgi:hypothetical protein